MSAYFGFGGFPSFGGGFPSFGGPPGMPPMAAMGMSGSIYGSMPSVPSVYSQRAPRVTFCLVRFSLSVQDFSAPCGPAGPVWGRCGNTAVARLTEDALPCSLSAHECGRLLDLLVHGANAGCQLVVRVPGGRPVDLFLNAGRTDGGGGRARAKGRFQRLPCSC